MNTLRPSLKIRLGKALKTSFFDGAIMGEPRDYGPKGGTVLFLYLLAIFSPNLSEIEKNSVPALGTVLQGVSHMSTEDRKRYCSVTRISPNTACKTPCTNWGIC